MPAETIHDHECQECGVDATGCDDYCIENLEPGEHVIRPTLRPHAPFARRPYSGSVNPVIVGTCQECADEPATDRAQSRRFDLDELAPGVAYSADDLDELFA